MPRTFRSDLPNDETNKDTLGIFISGRRCDLDKIVDAVNNYILSITDKPLKPCGCKSEELNND